MQPINNNHQNTSHHEAEVNLLDYWHVLMKYKKSIIAIVMVASIAAVITSLLLTKMYKAQALIVPVMSKKGGGLSGLSSQFGGLASLAGISLPGGSREDIKKIMAILKSRTLAENVVNRENLMPILFESKWDSKNGRWKTDDPNKLPNMEKAVKKMKSAVTVMEDKKNNTIKIKGVSKDRQLAARLVNAYISELQNFINANAFTVAKRNRVFIEGQLEKSKRDILESGKEIADFYTKNKISNVRGGVDVVLGGKKGIGVLNEGEILKIADVSLFVSDGDVLVSDASSGLKVSGEDLSELMVQKAGIDMRLADVEVVKDVPQQVYLAYVVLQRELLAKVNVLLTTQYEMAKIDEAQEALAFQVIDKAVPPVMRFSPRRTRICIMSFIAALFFAVLQALFRDYIRRMYILQR